MGQEVHPVKPPEGSRFHPSVLEDPNEIRRDFMGQEIHGAGKAGGAGERKKEIAIFPAGKTLVKSLRVLILSISLGKEPARKRLRRKAGKN